MKDEEGQVLGESVTGENEPAEFQRRLMLREAQRDAGATSDRHQEQSQRQVGT
jgi:hypothetical protein